MTLSKCAIGRVFAGALFFYPLLLSAQLPSKYIGEVVTQRAFYSGAKLHYDDKGRLLEPASVCSWTMCAKIRITAVRVEGSTLQISGERQFLEFSDPGTKEGVDVFSDHNLPLSQKVEDQLRAKRAVEIDVDRSSGANADSIDGAIRTIVPWDDNAIDTAMRAIFLTPAENLVDFVPEFWVPYFCRNNVPSARCASDSRKRFIFKVGGGVAAPRAIATPDPVYDESARLAAYQGRVILWLIITSDGKPSDIKIAKPLGLGLDDKAVEAVSKWAFEPAKKDGQPVAVQINIEVNFRLY